MLTKNWKLFAPVVPLASKVKSSPSHIISFVAPLIKLIAGKAVVFTVMVTTLEAAVSISPETGQVLDPKLTYANLLNAVVVDIADGS